MRSLNLKISIWIYSIFVFVGCQSNSTSGTDKGSLKGTTTTTPSKVNLTVSQLIPITVSVTQSSDLALEDTPSSPQIIYQNKSEQNDKTKTSNSDTSQTFGDTDINSYPPGEDVQMMEESDDGEVQTANSGSSLSLDALATPSSYTVEVAGCDSGFNPSLTTVGGTLKLYLNDTSCYGKLDTMTINGITYTPQGVLNAASWAVNQVVSFQDGGGTNSLSVKVIAQLASPIGNANTIEFKFYGINEGTVTTPLVQGDVSVAHTVTVSGNTPPSFTLKVITFSGIVAAGAGEFQFKMECTADLTASAGHEFCLDADMSDLEYKLVEDTYASVVSYAAAQTILATAGDGTSITMANASEFKDVGTVGMLHGGFITVALDGPAAMHNHPHMILLIGKKDGSGNFISYTYYNVDVSTLSNAQ